MDTRRKQHSRWSLYLIPATVLLIALLATYNASAYNAKRNTEQFESRFNALASQTTLLIQEKLDRYPLLLKTTRALVLSHLDNLSDHWSSYFKEANLDLDGNGIIGLTFTRYIDNEQRDLFIKQQRSLLNDPDFKLFPESNHSNSFVLMHAVPTSIIQRVRGYDIGTEEKRRFAAERAKNMGSLALSEPISLLPTEQHSVDYLFLMPVESVNPNDMYSPLFHGWVTIGFSLSKLLEETLNQADPMLHVNAVDERVGHTAIYDSHPEESVGRDLNPFQLKHTLELSRQRIDLYYTPLNSFSSTGIPGRHDSKTLLAGTTISILSALACFLLLGGRASALRQAEAMTRISHDSNSRYQTLFESSPEAIILSVKNRIILANSSAVTLLGENTIEDLIGKDVLDIATASNRNSAQELMTSLSQGGDKAPPLAVPLVRADGTTFDAEMSMSRTTYDGAVAIQLIFRDISDAKQRRNAAKIAQKVLEHTTEAIMVTDNNARIILTNPAFTALTGYTEKQALNQKTSLLRSGHHDADFYAVLWKDLQHTGQWVGEIANRKRSGEVYIQKTNISAVYDKGGDISHFVCVMSDITEQKRTFDTIRFQALHDTLTKLPNRIHFEARAEKVLARARLTGGYFAILFIDLDDFKPINDTHGHLLGDKLLIALADKLSAALRPSDMVSRIGGDEFLVLADELTRPEEAHQLAKRLMQMIGAPVVIDDIELRVSASIGISLYPTSGDNIDDLIHAADQAMYRAKNRGKNQITSADPNTLNLIDG
ncbi:diguanylate cyclase [Pontibacterium granulatum]|uniref:sensor domain-containing diguanylate cyclase n=1 Tax=Pontibacterium granulatum TaxID=2036029 RepID=UPI00249CF3BA|nr:diguanylate cyclase [Pontibacterium granulatum]MDI3325506.1 diguanylate cyclase [Pontibacterium granulatum]